MNQFFWTAFEVCLNIFQGTLCILFLNRVLPERTPKKWPGILFAALFALFCSSYLLFDLPLADTWLFSAPIAYSILFRKGSIQSKLLWNTILIMTFNGVINCLYFVFSLLGISFADIISQSSLRLVTIPLVNLAIATTLYLISYRPPTTFDRLFPVLLFTLINIIANLSMDFFWSLYETNPELERTVFLFCSLSYILTLAAYLIYRIMSEYAQRDIERERQDEMRKQEEQRLEELKSIYSSLRGLRHDLKNHIQISRMLYESGKTDEGSAYLEQIDRDIFSVFSTGSLAIDSALTMKDLQMRRRNIRFIHALCPLDELPISESELCSILSNLLDNALEGISRAETLLVDPVITLNIARIRDMLYIHCSNSYDPSTIHANKETFLSSKKQPGHGLGIPNIEFIVTKANGTSHFSAEEFHFVAEISLPYKD